METKLDFHDIRVIPAVISEVSSRSEINPFYLLEEKKFYLPIFTAPMDTVINSNNKNLFLKNKIRTIIPRGEKYFFHSQEKVFVSYGIDDFCECFIDIKDSDINERLKYTQYVLIDVANGHMRKLIDIVKKAKLIYKDKMVLMVGNIANPQTYSIFAEIGVDFCRCGIGNGSACLTTKQTTIGYPMASLIQECREIKVLNNYKTCIVADGGMKDFSDIILALALGADYVMVGSLFNKSLESCGDTYVFNKIKINQHSKFALWLFKRKITLTKKYRGMSTKEVQRKWGKKTIKTSEGVSKKQKVEYTLSQWVENFEDFLRSTMSYTNSKTLKDFIGKVEIVKISDKAYDRFNK